MQCVVLFFQQLGLARKVCIVIMKSSGINTLARVLTLGQCQCNLRIEEQQDEAGLDFFMKKCPKSPQGPGNMAEFVLTQSRPTFKPANI